MDGVTAVIIGRSYGGKSLGQQRSTGAIKVQRQMPGGLKAVMQSEKGLQELFIQTAENQEDEVSDAIARQF